MAKRNYKYNNTVDLSNLIYKTKRNYIDWKASIGKTIPFTFNDGKLVGEFTIIDYKTPNDAVNPHVIRSNVSSVCVGRYKQHKGYIFSHTPLSQESLKDSLLLYSNE